MKQLEEAQQLQIRILGKDNKAFIILFAHQLEAQIEWFNQFVNTQDFVANDEKWLELNIKSNNPFSRVKDMLEKNGVVPAFFDSLLLSIKFVKSENIKQLVMGGLKSTFPQAVSQSFIDSF